MIAVLGLGDLRDSAVLEVPVRALRRSLVILGLDRAPDRSRRGAVWLLGGVLAVVLAVVAVLLLRRR
jgi:hypothetical protein